MKSGMLWLTVDSLELYSTMETITFFFFFFFFFQGDQNTKQKKNYPETAT